MGESSDAREEPGAPIARDKVDVELIKLSRAPSRIGIVTCAGVVLLAIVFILRLNPDRRFGGAGDTPAKATIADITSGKLALDSYLSLDAEPMMSHAIRAARSKTGVGVRLVPVRGSGDQLWLVMTGDGWQQPSTTAYTGRLRELGDLPFADVARDYAKAHPRPLFATAAATRAGFSSNKVTTVAGDTIALADTDRVALDVIDPNVAIVVASINENHPSAEAWNKALTDAGIDHGPPIVDAPTEGEGSVSFEQVRFEIKGGVAAATTKLEAKELFAARVDPVREHYETTWGALKGSTAAGFTMGQVTVPDADLELVGLYVAKGIPGGAYVLIANEHPQQYWYVLPITIALAIIALLFGWALVRAVRRDFLPTRAA